MAETSSAQFPSKLLEAASDFAHYPGVHNDASAKDFLDRYPLPVMFSALQTNGNDPGLESTLVACLERVFGTKYGASFIPQYMSFVQVGMHADSQLVKYLACKTVFLLLENVDQPTGSAAQLVIENSIYPLLLDCLIHGDEKVATASMDAIKSFASSPKGTDIIFGENDDEPTSLRNVAARSSSLGRIRVLALIVKLFSVSSSVASAVHNSNLLCLLEAELKNTNDMLSTLSALELLYELSEIPHGAKFLSRTTLLQLLTSLISTSAESVLRSRATMISGRLLCSENTLTLVDESSVKNLLSVIDRRMERLEDQDMDECESALEAIGQIGSSIQGAGLLLSSSSSVARHVIDAAFDRQGRGKQLAALHALGNISGENRPEGSKVLNDVAEGCLRRLIYETAARSSKLTPSGLFLSVLRQESEIRLAVYRLIAGLVARPWCLQQICSKHEIIDIVTDPHIESTKNGMEARYNCCKAIHMALSSSSTLSANPAVAEISTKLMRAVQRGPYLARERIEAQPTVVTADR